MLRYLGHRWLLLLLPLLLATCLAGWALLRPADANADQGASMMMAHNVYFALNDNSPEARQKLVAACEKHLTDHPGTLVFACGTVADLDRPVNQRDFDVGLHMLFQDRKAHDEYQEAPRHKQFITENQSNWKKVRVFDTDVRAGSAQLSAR
ncbi:MAG TPA: Dabb family protein [Pirellulales bacterium]|jgi:hypothetical protein|nr:Dabb family protein [Pirellulales bacterium]